MIRGETSGSGSFSDGEIKGQVHFLTARIASSPFFDNLTHCNTLSDPAGEALTYTALQSSGAALPAYLTFNGATRTFTTTSVLNDRDPLIKLTATDTQGRSVSDTFVFYMDGYVINTNVVSAGGALATPQTTQQTTTPRKLPRQADTSEVEPLATCWRYSARVRSPRLSCGRCSLYSIIHQ